MFEKGSLELASSSLDYAENLEEQSSSFMAKYEQ